MPCPRTVELVAYRFGSALFSATGRRRASPTMAVAASSAPPSPPFACRRITPATVTVPSDRSPASRSLVPHHGHGAKDCDDEEQRARFWHRELQSQKHNAQGASDRGCGVGESGDPSATRASARSGNEQYKRRNYGEALRSYDKAVAMCLGNAASRSNRATALVGLGRLGEAMRECQEAVRLDPSSYRARITASLLYTHEARKIGDWKSALREADAAIAAGADSSPTVSSEKKNENAFDARVFGLHPDSCIYIVRAQVDMSLGRFESAVELAEKATRIDPRNMELTLIVNNVNQLQELGLMEKSSSSSEILQRPSTAYSEGLELDSSNLVLLCNRAACRSKLGQWEKSIEDCKQAVKIQPSYIKALLRRADSNAKIEQWAESVRDYEVLNEEIPGDTVVAESLFHAEVVLKISRSGGVSNLQFGGEVEDVTSLNQLQAAICLPGIITTTIVIDCHASKCLCLLTLLNVFPIHEPKVDINKSPTVTKSDSVRSIPTFKIYKNGIRIKEMNCPSQQVLEYPVGRYSQG
ncbi:hypothetical protein ZIOFF_010739 [Zingiber officinale]|uniref:Uncharacterized protein n=1 Tax=Zingiber officinale TaxID=94328 RepID=A0A8J5I4Q4_ZINOF|nr:hypothetical protein ZIOFF_010739 [Zingiber officinale]